MARNPFEQLQDTALEPRQAFEDITATILRCIIQGSRRVRVYRGDGGVDVFNGNYGVDGSVDVFQIKFFPQPWGDAQKQQIRDSYKTAAENSDYNLGKWTLCVPVRLTKEDFLWFHEWRGKKEHPIELIDGDDLTDALNNPACMQARAYLRNLGVQGLIPGGPHFQASVTIRPESVLKSGLTAVLIVQIHNDGDRTAKSLNAVVNHSETCCLSYQAPPDWQQPPDDGSLNPRRLRYKQVLNPGDRTISIGIPLCDRTAFPFRVSLSLTAEDCIPCELHCQIEQKNLVAGEAVAFSSEPVPLQNLAGSTDRHQPTSPAAVELWAMIQAHPVEAERGLTHILQGWPGSTLDTGFIPNATEGGTAFPMKKSLFLQTVTELVQLGWLAAPEGDEDTEVFVYLPDKRSEFN